MMMMMLGLVCCCCVALSGTLGGLYFLHDGFKNWVNGLFGKGAAAQTNEQILQEFADKKCKWSGRDPAFPTVHTCYPAVPTLIDLSGKSQTALGLAVLSTTDGQSPRAGWERVHHVHCVANAECQALINKVI